MLRLPSAHACVVHHSNHLTCVRGASPAVSACVRAVCTRAHPNPPCSYGRVMNACRSHRFFLQSPLVSSCQVIRPLVDHLDFQTSVLLYLMMALGVLLRLSPSAEASELTQVGAQTVTCTFVIDVRRILYDTVYSHHKIHKNSVQFMRGLFCSAVLRWLCAEYILGTTFTLWRAGRDTVYARAGVA